jgi:hypothetical protein
MENFDVLETWRFLVQEYREAKDEWQLKEADTLMKAILELAPLVTKILTTEK